MANSLLTSPIIVDTDITSFKAAVAALGVQNFGATNGPTIAKLMLVVATGGASTGGSVTITNPLGNALLYPPILVTAATVASTNILNDNVPESRLIWKDFAVTGVTATGTRLFLWIK